MYIEYTLHVHCTLFMYIIYIMSRTLHNVNNEKYTLYYRHCVRFIVFNLFTYRYICEKRVRDREREGERDIEKESEREIERKREIDTLAYKRILAYNL